MSTFDLERDFMKNILLLGSSSSLFVKDFCIEVLNNNRARIAVLSREYSKQYEDDYKAYNVKQVKWPEMFIQGIKSQLGINLIKKYIFCIRNLKREMGFENEIDVMFVHYVEPLYILYFWRFWKKAEKKILVFWGDDILRASSKKLKLFPFFLKRSTSIVFMIQNQCEYFQSKLGHRYDDKICVLDFGNSILKRIDKTCNNYNKEQCKEKFGIATDKISIHVGYNAFRGQQHIEIMESIVAWTKRTSAEKWRDKLEFVFHISYGQDDNFEAYLEEMKYLMDKVNLRYIFIEEYLKEDNLAMFRQTCDIFLYGQKTDARSASPLEYIYAGAYFICPSWLQDNYKILNDGNIQYFVYNGFTDLINVFDKCLMQYNEFNGISEEGKKIIRDAISWESLAPKWRLLYE